MEELVIALAKLDDLKIEVQNPLREVNLGTSNQLRMTYVSGSL